MKSEVVGRDWGFSEVLSRHHPWRMMGLLWSLEEKQKDSFIQLRSAMVAHACYPSTQEGDSGGQLQVQGQLELLRRKKIEPGVVALEAQTDLL